MKMKLNNEKIILISDKSSDNPDVNIKDNVNNKDEEINIHSETSLKIDNKKSLNESNSNKNNTNINTQNTTLKRKIK